MTPDEMRALADVVDRAADNDRNPTRVPLLHEAAAALRDAADRLDAVYWDRFQDGWNAALTTPTDQEASK